MPPSIPASVSTSSTEPPLKFQLATSEKHGGYHMTFSHARIAHLRRVLSDSRLVNLNVEEACQALLAKSTEPRTADAEPHITKKNFDSAIKGILRWNIKASADVKLAMHCLMDVIFACCDREGLGRPNVAELACGLTVFCQGKKSDKLEYAFELMDKKKRGKLSKKEMNKYLQSFLTVLLSISICPELESDPATDALSTLSGEPVDRSNAAVIRAVKSGAEWTTALIFREMEKQTNSFMTFDDFATWYTAKGCASIPWLELIDLRKWVV
jgi:Ca2+-binding EF-hand superfamily protein